MGGRREGTRTNNDTTCVCVIKDAGGAEQKGMGTAKSKKRSSSYLLLLTREGPNWVPHRWRREGKGKTGKEMCTLRVEPSNCSTIKDVHSMEGARGGRAFSPPFPGKLQGGKEKNSGTVDQDGRGGEARTERGNSSGVRERGSKGT